jgi:phosphate starvation-inducible PhoH-like protein
MKKNRAVKRAQSREIEDDETIKNILEDHYKKVSFTLKKPLKLLPKHQELLQLIQNEKTNMVFVNGPAGSAKTYVSVYGALELLKQEKVDEIVYIRSIIESASRSIGALPGEIDEKFQPYTMPLVDKLREIIPVGQISTLFANNMIRTVPVNFTRGLTFHKACVILDETQNLTRKELVTILTRFGTKSIYIVCGDSFQSDIKDTGFKDIMTAFNTPISKSHNIHCIDFGRDEIVRSPILKHIVDVIGS